MTTMSAGQVEEGLFPFRAARRVVLRRLVELVAADPAFRNSALLLMRLFVRLKSADSILEKMRRKAIAVSHPAELVVKMPDVLGGRVIVETSDELEAVDRLLRGGFELRSVNDSVAVPTEYGGRGREYALGVSVAGGSIPFEVQARTALQHEWSVRSFHLFHKKPPEEARRHADDLRRLSEALREAEGPAARLGATAPACAPAKDPPGPVQGLEDCVHLVVVAPGERLAEVVVLPLSGEDARNHARTVEAKLALYDAHPGSAVVEASCMGVPTFLLNEPHVRVSLDRIGKVVG